MFLVLFRKEMPSLESSQSPEPHLHWNPEIPRRGMGDLIRSVNHIAIIVSDVGRSLAFYTEIIGFQQIQRPNFDRHGAWLTMGNLELHLIKGVPNAPSGRDLIVSHIALDTNEPHKVLEKLLEYEVPFRQNISVPDPKKARENLVEAFENSEGKITQYFVRDPDGYYLELCNCDVLTAFCLFKENAKEKKPGYVPKYKKLMDAMLSTYNESGQAKASSFRFPQLLKTTVLIHRLVRKARGELKKPFQERVEKALEGVEEAAVPDGQLLEKFMGRQKTYCDICQGFSEEDLASALCKSGNYAPTALLLLAACRQDVRVFFPPQYLLSEGGRIKQQVMAVSAPTRSTRKSFGSFSMFASKPFEDADGSVGSGSTRLSVSSSASFLSRISGTHQSSTHDEEKPKERRKSGLIAGFGLWRRCQDAELPQKELELCLSWSSGIRAGTGRDLCVMESSHSVKNCSRLTLSYFVCPCWARIQLFRQTIVGKCWHSVFFPASWLPNTIFNSFWIPRITNTCANPSRAASVAAGYTPSLSFVQKDLMPLGPFDWFPRVLFESQRALLLPRSPQREQIAVDTELWCTLHVCRKNLWAIQSLDVQVRRIPMSSLAQFASGMRQLNCGSSSRFRIHLARMWVKTNRTKTESMDINTMLVYFWHSDEYLTHHQPHLFKSFPRFLGTRRGVFFPARWGPDPGEVESSKLAPFRVAKVGHMQLFNCNRQEREGTLL